MLLEVATCIFKCNPLCCKHNISAQEIMFESKCSQNQGENNTKNDLNTSLFFGNQSLTWHKPFFAVLETFLGMLICRNENSVYIGLVACQMVNTIFQQHLHIHLGNTLIVSKPEKWFFIDSFPKLFQQKF